MERLDDLLEKTSRTFALSIPLLPEPTRRSVAIAYLLFRIADTFEDATRWRPERRIAALEEFAGLLGSRGGDADSGIARWLENPPLDHPGYLELLGAAREVLEDYRGLPPLARAILEHHLRRTAVGMADVVRGAEPDGALRLHGLDDLRRYCYIVAGIVGEMLSELYVLDWKRLRPSAAVLSRRAPFFGEALQLVNILKDSAADLSEGRAYLPKRIDRAAVFALARRDLRHARYYVDTIQRRGAPDGLVAFNALPALLASASLDRIEDRGPGAKLTRGEVAEIAAAMGEAIAAGRPAIPSGTRPIPSGR